MFQSLPMPLAMPANRLNDRFLSCTALNRSLQFSPRRQLVRQLLIGEGTRLAVCVALKFTTCFGHAWPRSVSDEAATDGLRVAVGGAKLIRSNMSILFGAVRPSVRGPARLQNIVRLEPTRHIASSIAMCTANIPSAQHCDL